MKTIYLKSLISIISSIVLTFLLTGVVFFPESPQLRPAFANISERIISIFIGSKGEAVRPGLDPIPPGGI